MYLPLHKQLRSARYKPRWYGRLRGLCLYVYVPLGAVLLVVAGQRAVSTSVLFRDPNVLADAPFYAGILSNLGVLLWWTAAVVGFLSYSLLRTFARSRRAHRYFFLAVAAFTALLALDDLLMLHEEVFPNLLGVPEIAVFGLYALLFAVLLVTFRTRVIRLGLALPGSALAFFGVSVLIDLGLLRFFFELPPGLDGYLEDSAKLLGIASWCYFLVRLALADLGAVLGPRRAARKVPAASGGRYTRAAEPGVGMGD